MDGPTAFSGHSLPLPHWLLLSLLYLKICRPMETRFRLYTLCIPLCLPNSMPLYATLCHPMPPYATLCHPMPLSLLLPNMPNDQMGFRLYPMCFSP
ncbi:uncharacterized protein EI90DRAFT_508171 [Cantharellus anzutake]|uniref:uncharacterized protein n=1 Tax=Cantharellus anzutake TaxID=1750568 RepID=UPI0019049924|nr:uncharacterized protein EI90DRAFT_508171 [Cantharellus anzutake]KAF8334111.1 hypothetical protein EI90DRAFT_508171 [Cantharellus anzutake]